MRRTKLALLIAIVGLAVMGCANASWMMDTVLSGNLGIVNLHCTVSDPVSGIYTYTYTLTATDLGLFPVSAIDIGNPQKLQFTNATNTGADESFSNPSYVPWLNSITGAYGELDEGHTATFKYTSAYKPTAVDVTVLGGGTSTSGAGGKTLGMVPEPATVVAACAILAPAGLLVRRRRKA